MKTLLFNVIYCQYVIHHLPDLFDNLPGLGDNVGPREAHNASHLHAVPPSSTNIHDLPVQIYNTSMLGI